MVYLFLTCVNFSHLHSALHLVQNTYQDFFSAAESRKVLELVNFDAFECFCHFLIFASSTSAKCFPLRTFFIQEANKKVTRVRSVNREGGHRGVLPFLVKNCWTLSTVWAFALENHPSRNGRTWWKSLQKKSLKPNAASYNNASQYTNTVRFLEHSPSPGGLYYKGPTLQERVSFWGRSPPCIH